MSDANENEVNEKEADTNLIGVDPLAWLSDEEKQSVLQESQKKEEAVSSEETDDETNEVMAEMETVAEAEEEEAEKESVSVEAENKSSYTVKLESAVTIRDAAELMDELSFIDAGVKEIIFDCDQIEKTDAAALQLLTGYYLFAIEDGKKVVWNNPSDAFCHSVSLLGLDDIIKISQAA